MENNLSIIDVARAAGVGVGTVSRVLNHAPNVNPETATLVHAAVAKLGYRLPARQNRRGPRSHRKTSSSRTRREILLAVLGPQGLDWVLQCAPVFSGVLHGIEGAVSDRGLLLTMRQAANWQELAGGIESELPSALIVLGFETGIGSRSGLPRAIQQLPTVWTMGSPLDFRGDHVQPDHMKIGTTAAEYLLQKGCKRFAAIGTGLGSPANLKGFRNDSFQWTVRQHGGTAQMLLSPNLIGMGPGMHEVNSRELETLIAEMLKGPQPDALFLESDILAPAVYQRLAAAGIRPQEDFEIVTCNNERPYLSPLVPKPTVIDIQPQIIGRRAVDQLLWRSENLHAPAMRIMVEPVLVTTDTVAL